MRFPSLGLPLFRFIVVLLITPLCLAQSGMWQADCPACAAHLGGSGVMGPFASEAECEVGRENEAKLGFIFGPCHLVGAGAGHVIVTPEGAVRGAEIIGPAGGALAGGFETNPAGQYAIAPGAGVGMLFSEAVLAANRTHFSKGKVMTLSVVNMTAAGAGAAGLQQFYQENTDKSKATPSPTVVGAGAGAGLVTGFVLGELMTKAPGSGSASHFLRALGHMYLGGTPRNMSMRITW